MLARGPLLEDDALAALRDTWVTAADRGRVTGPPDRPSRARPTQAGLCRGPAQRTPHWNVTVLVPSGLVPVIDVIGCEPYFAQ
jgi:hypothetical protein